MWKLGYIPWINYLIKFQTHLSKIIADCTHYIPKHKQIQAEKKSISGRAQSTYPRHPNGIYKYSSRAATD